MRKPNRKCSLCGQEYYYCPSCSDGREPSWMIMFDTENCKKIFNVLTQFNFKHIKENEAKSILKNCDLTVNMNERDKGTVDKIMCASIIEADKIVPVDKIIDKTIPNENLEDKENVIEKDDLIIEKINEDSVEEQKIERNVSKRNRKNKSE